MLNNCTNNGIDDTVNAQQQIGTTTLHKVYVVYRGVEMVAREEIEDNIITWNTETVKRRESLIRLILRV